MRSHSTIPAGDVKKLVSQMVGSGFRPVDALAAAITYLKYEGSFALAPSAMKEFEAAIRKETIPTQIQLILGESIDSRSFASRSISPKSMLSLAVLHRCVKDFSNDLSQVIHQALDLSTNSRIGLRWGITEAPFPIMRTGIGGSHKTAAPISQDTRRAYKEVMELARNERAAKDPALNGRPEEALQVPSPDLQDSFSWWCLQLGFMVASPHADALKYVEVIDTIGDHCIRLMPKAQAQALELAKSGRDDRYGSTENVSLPKYIRWLLKRGLTDRAKFICEMALQWGISPKSPGAFERGLAAASKKSRVKNSRQLDCAGRLGLAAEQDIGSTVSDVSSNQW